MRYYKNLSIDESNCTVEKRGPVDSPDCHGVSAVCHIARPFRACLLPKSSAVIRLAYHNSDSDTDGRCTYREITEEAGLGAK